MAKKFTIISLGAIAFLGLGACQTVPSAERAKLYENTMREQFVGKSFDAVVLAFGPPNSNYTMNDGRTMYQYNFTQTSTYSSGGSLYYGGMYGGRHSSIGYGFGLPFQILGGTNQYTHVCTRRFLVNNAKIVEDFKFEGNSCY